MPRRLFDDPDTPLVELLNTWPSMAKVFFRHQMICVGCMVAPFHTITDACIEYHLDEVLFRQELWAAAI